MAIVNGKIVTFSGDERFLSNFEPAIVKLDGIAYRTVEHAFQAAKTMDLRERLRIEQCGTPGNAKQRGRRVVLRDNWEDTKIGVMRDLIGQKFAPGTEFAAKLIATHPMEIIEGNHWGDRFWGRTVDLNGDYTIGLNWLGEILMRQREALNGH